MDRSLRQRSDTPTINIIGEGPTNTSQSSSRIVSPSWTISCRLNISNWEHWKCYRDTPLNWLRDLSIPHRSSSVHLSPLNTKLQSFWTYGDDSIGPPGTGGLSLLCIFLYGDTLTLIQKIRKSTTDRVGGKCLSLWLQVPRMLVNSVVTWISGSETRGSGLRKRVYVRRKPVYFCRWTVCQNN